MIGLVENAPSPQWESPGSATRAFARVGLDAIAVSPGVLERVADDLSSLTLVLRLNLPSARQRLVSIQGALEMGAEAVAVTIDATSPRDLELLGRTAEDARRWGMPLIAEMFGEDFREISSLAAEFGADVIQLAATASDVAQLRAAVKTARRPVLVRISGGEGEGLIRSLNSLLETGIEGIVVEPLPERSLHAIHGLIHQGASLEEALGVIVGSI